MKITVPRKQLLAFRNACREVYPCETIAVLRGTRTHDGVIVTEIKPIPHTADANGINDYSKELLRSKIAALRAGSEFVGTLHSHCFIASDPCCWHLSKTDIVTALKDGEAVCGIVYVYDEGHKTQVHWYIPTPIPEVHYV